MQSTTPHARLSFLERDGIGFRFEWAGVWGEEYGQDVPLSAYGWAEFTAVIVREAESATN
jgi:hypothetical protein